MTRASLEARFMRVDLLPNYPFLQVQWGAILLRADDIFSEKGFRILYDTCITTSRDEEILFCLTTFADFAQQSKDVRPCWREQFDWPSVDQSKEPAWQFAWSGMYFLGASALWGGIYLDSDFVIFGAERPFLREYKMRLQEADWVGQKVIDDYISSNTSCPDYSQAVVSAILRSCPNEQS